MKRKIVLLSLVAMVISLAGYAQSKKEKDVGDAGDKLKETMISGDSSKLVSIAADDLSYGHSGGKIENKTAFVAQSSVAVLILLRLISANKRSGSITIEQSLHMYSMLPPTTIKTRTVKLSILTVCNRQHGSWKMVARQAVRPQ